jgi:outer membrane protein assembly factor BamB
LTVVGDNQNIALAFFNNLVLINPTTGRPIELRDSNNQVRLDEQGNPRVWNITAPANSQGFYAAPISAADDTTFVVAYARKVFRLDTANGVLFNGTTGVDLPGHVIATPLINGDLVYIGFSERNLTAYNVDDLRSDVLVEAWTLETEHGIWATPLLVDNVLYVPSMDHILYALDAATGEVLWSADLQGALSSTPVYHEGRLYIGSLGRKVFEVDAASGQILSEFTTADWVWASSVVVENTLYAADMGGNVYALTIGEGGLTQLWAARPSNMGIRATPIVENGLVIVASRDASVYWLNAEDGSALTDAEGNPLRRQLAGEILADMLVLRPSETLDIPQPMLLVSTMVNTELLVAFTLDTGQRQWVYGQ